MEESKIKFIEASLDAFRAINTFWFLKGPYPKNSSAEIWTEEDYKNETSRRIMREDFERHLEILVKVHNTHVKTLYYAVPNIESEYNNIFINARNMEQAINLFKEKFLKAMFSLENEYDANQLLKNYLLPLKEHGIITIDEGNNYQELVCRIVMYYTEAVTVICSVFQLERPWNRMTVNSGKALSESKAESEQDNDDNNKQTFNEKREDSHAISTKRIDNSKYDSIENKLIINESTDKNHKKGRKQAFNYLIDHSISEIVTHESGSLQLGEEIKEFVISHINKNSTPEQVVSLTIALEICELIPDLVEKKSAYFEILQKETGISFVLKTFSNKYKVFCDKEHDYKNKAKTLTHSQNNNLSLIIDYIETFKEIKMKYKKEVHS